MFMINTIRDSLGILMFISAISLSQSNKICLGGYFGNSLSINSSYTLELPGNFFAKPNVGISLHIEDKELYSFITYEISAGYYIYKSFGTKYYISAGGSYNAFLKESREGNASFISDKTPPYSYVGKQRDNGFGFSAKIGVISEVSSWFCFGLEAAYQSLFTSAINKYIPRDYIQTKKNEVINTIVFGFVLGVSF